MTRRGFSLLEVSVATALAGVILIASLSATTTIQRALNSARLRGQLSERRELLEEFFGPLLRQVGQNSVRPWEAVLSSCVAADCRQQHIHVLELEPDPHLRLDSAWDGSSTTITIAKVGAKCPLSPSEGWSGARKIVIVPETTSTTSPSPAFRPGWATAVCTPNPGLCTCALAPVPGVNDDAETRALVTTWGRARVALGQTVTLLRDTAANELILRRDNDGDGSRDAVRVINDVYGLDIAYGVVQADGSMLFQSTVPTATPSDLRLLRLELALGVKDSNLQQAGSTTLFNGVVTRAATRLTHTSTVAALATAAAL